MNLTARRRLSVFGILSSVILSAVVLSLAGCSLVPPPATDPTRYYVLTGAGAETERPAKTGGALVLGLKRIDIAPYLNGKDMVVREGGNEIAYQSFARWAEPLATSMGRTLSGRLARAGNVSRVYAQPFSFEVERDYDVSIRVFRCEGERKDGKAFASFSALVEVTEAKPAGAIILRKVFTAPEAEWDGRNFSALALALSESVAALGDEVIAALPVKTAE
jgi:uncharacterized protein